jgi:hypothetical protein
MVPKKHLSEFSYLKNQKVLLLSDTGNPYSHILNFLPELAESKVFIYVSPASTANFIKLFVFKVINRKVKIIKDKNFKLFDSPEIAQYHVCIFFGNKSTKETKLLRTLTRHLLVSYKNIIVITKDGIDYDANYSL